MFSTYFYGCWWLPAMLTLLDFDVLKLGKVVSDSDTSPKQPQEGPTDVPEQPGKFEAEESVDLDDFDENNAKDALHDSTEVAI